MVSRMLLLGLSGASGGGVLRVFSRVTSSFVVIIGIPLRWYWFLVRGDEWWRPGA